MLDSIISNLSMQDIEVMVIGALFGSTLVFGWAALRRKKHAIRKVWKAEIPATYHIEEESE